MQQLQNEQPEIEIEEDVILPAYRPLLYDDQFSIEFLYGGRDSAKSYTTAQLLIIECLSLPYFRCALIREQFGTIKDSQWQLIKDITETWGVSHLFTFTKAPLEIVCYNGNKFISRGCDEPQNLKSITACNRAWIEEGLEDRDSFTVILTTLRSNESKVRIFYTFNPECEGNYMNFWLYEDWFADWWNPSQLSYTGIRTFSVIVAGVEKKVSIKYRATHSTYHDNPYVSDERIAFHENNKGYYYTVYTKGLWGYKITGGEFWTQFKADKHTADVELIRDEDGKLMPVFICVDNNLVPYITIAIWQVDNENAKMIQVDELPCYSPDNSTTKAAHKLITWLRSNNYRDMVNVCGDSTANAANTIDDNNRSFFEKFIEILEDEGFHVNNLVGRSNPRVALSGDFINEIFENGVNGWHITINKSCMVSIEDYTMSKKDTKTGGILKKRITNKETGQSYEQYGHYSDTMRYFICTVMKDEYEAYAYRGRRKISYV